jgi:hypothetical protein
VLSDQALDRVSAWQMIKRRVRGAGPESTICNHSFRATGITAYLRSGGTLEKAQQIAGIRVLALRSSTIERGLS